MQIGIDLGGSHIGIGLVNNGKIIQKEEKNLLIKENTNIQEEIETIIHGTIQRILQNQKIQINEIKSIGLAVPGLVTQGKIINTVNLKLKDYNLYDELKKYYDVPIHIRNDAKCAAIAEKEYGSLKQYSDCVFLTIGTGIGGAVFLDGKLLKPKKAEGFELGHMVISKQAKQCKCGQKGCFESYASITALKNDIKQELKLDTQITGEELLNILKQNLQTESIKAIIENYTQNLCIGLLNIIKIFQPEAISIGGSFSYYKDIFLEKIEKNLKENKTLFNKEVPHIILAHLKNDAGIIGAAGLKNFD